MSKVDWSKAGTRIRHTPRTLADGGRNPDWNFVAQRWKDAVDYQIDAMTTPEIMARALCPTCGALIGKPCLDARDQPMPDNPHPGRRRAAAQEVIDNA